MVLRDASASKKYQSILDGLTQNVSKLNGFLAFSKFLKQKTFGIAIKLFSDSTIWCSSAGITTNNNYIQKWGTLSLLYESFLRLDL